MKRLVSVLLVILFVGASAYAQSLAPADRERAVKHLEATRKNILETTKGLSETQWNFKPAPDRWSVAEVTEHIAATEDMLFGMVREQVMKAPSRPAGEDVKAIDEFVLARVPDRTNKAQAPDKYAQADQPLRLAGGSAQAFRRKPQQDDQLPRKDR